MQIGAQHLRRVARLGAHMLGSIGVALAIVAMLPWLDPSATSWLPWEASNFDQISSMFCGVVLMAGGSRILRHAADGAAGADGE
jgi:hypothetical protein